MANAPLVIEDNESENTELPAETPTFSDEDDVTVDENIDENIDENVEEETEEIDTNPELTNVLNFYKCHDLMPFVTRVFWLSNVKEALGYIPREFDIDYMEIKSLVILNQEQARKTAFESYKMREKGKAMEAEAALKQPYSGRF